MKYVEQILSVVVEIAVAALVVVFLAFQFWLWYFAPCDTVKDWWLITHIPGRCIYVGL